MSDLLVSYFRAFEPDVTTVEKFFRFVVTYKFTTLRLIERG